MLEYGIDEVPVFTYENKGKPLLQGHPDIHFSMSHCHEAVAVAVSERPVGVDIETVDHYDPEVARHVMSDDEMRQIEASPQPEVAFIRLWTMKESFFKLTSDDHGGDMAGMLSDISKYRFTTTVHPRLIYTACTER